MCDNNIITSLASMHNTYIHTYTSYSSARSMHGGGHEIRESSLFSLLYELVYRLQVVAMHIMHCTHSMILYGVLSYCMHNICTMHTFLSTFYESYSSTSS